MKSATADPRIPTGLHAQGDVEYGAQLCAFHESDQDLRELMLSFVRAGALHGERCLLICAGARAIGRVQRVLQDASGAEFEILTTDSTNRAAALATLAAAIERHGPSSQRAALYLPHAIGIPAPRQIEGYSVVLWLHDLHGCSAVHLLSALDNHGVATVLRYGRHEIVGGAAARGAPGSAASDAAGLRTNVDELSARIASIAAQFDRHIGDPANHDLRLLHQAKVFERVQDAIVATDAKQRLVAWNEAATRLFGWSAGEVLGRSLPELTCTHASEQQWQQAQRMLEESGHYRGEWIQRRSDGSLVRVDTETITLNDESGRILYYVSLQRDPSQARRAEDRLRLVLEAWPNMVTIMHPDGRVWFRNRRWFEYTGLDLSAMAEGTVIRVLHPDERSEFITAWRAALRAGTPFERELRMRRHDGVFRWFMWRVQPLRNADNEVLGWYGTHMDIDDRHQLDAAMRLEAERAYLLAEMSQRFTEAGLEHQDVVHAAVRGAAEMLGDVCVLRLLDATGTLLVVAAIDHLDSEKLAAIRASGILAPLRADAPLRAAVLRGESLLIPEIDELHYEQFVQSVQGPVSRYPAASILIVPLRARGQVIGTFALSRDAPGRPYTERDRALAQELADRAALTIHNARLFNAVGTQREQLRKLGCRLLEAQESERRRLALELHDQLSQSLSGLGMQIGAVRGMLKTQRKRADAVLKDAESLAASILADVRRMIGTLRPLVLDDLGLRPALQRLGEELGEQTGARVRMRLEECSTRLATALETAVFRIAQEAMRNIRRHAAARRVDVELRFEPQRLLLTINDDGVGFCENVLASAARASESEGHFGLLGMRERALGLRGTIEVRSAPGLGTTVAVELPLESEPEP